MVESKSQFYNILKRDEKNGADEGILENIIAKYTAITKKPISEEQIIDPYEQVYRIAETATDFRKVLNAFSQTQQTRARFRNEIAYGINAEFTVEDELALRRAHSIYAHSQYVTAQEAAEQGDVDTFDEHMIKALGELSVGVGRKTLRLEPSAVVTDTLIQGAFSTLYSNVSEASLRGQMVCSANEGDMERTSRYANHFMGYLAEQEVIPDQRKRTPGYPTPSSKIERLIRAQRTVVGELSRSRTVCARRKVELAAAHAIREGVGGRYAISRLRDEVKSLFVTEYKAHNGVTVIDTTTFTDPKAADGSRRQIHNSITDVVDPFFDELLACSEDITHPFRSMYTVVEDPQGKIWGVKPVETTNEIVVYGSNVTHHDDVGEHAIPITVHPFYARN